MQTSLLTRASLATLLTLPALAQDRIAVTVENLSPSQGTFQTPVWIGIHDGSFDTYTNGVPVNGPNALVPNNAVERLAEDGATGFLSAEFLAGGTGTVDGTIFGPAGPIAPGDLAIGAFLVDPLMPSSRYFSYASMVIPSNDAFLANGDPLAHPLFDAAGNFVFTPFFDNGVVDAGSEVNDELPMNTAFLGQAAPDTGVAENGNAMLHAGFNAPGTGGILDDYRFQNGDFAQPGYPALRVQIKRSAAVTDNRNYIAAMTGAEEVPANNSSAKGRVLLALTDQGTKLTVTAQFRQLTNFVGLHLHLAPAGANGPVVMSLAPAREPGGGNFGTMLLTGEFDLTDVAGPLAGFPLDELVAALEAGQVYANVHTNDGVVGDDTGPGDFASGELRGQLARF